MEPSQPSKPTTVKRFDDLFRFVDIHLFPSAFDLAAHTSGRNMPELDLIVGNAMVEKATYMPVGFCVAYFEPCGTTSIQASFANYFRTWPKDIMQGMAPVIKRIFDAGVTELHAIADEEIEGAIDLVRWAGGEKTGDRSDAPPIGDVYRIDMNGKPMQRWMALAERGNG